MIDYILLFLLYLSVFDMMFGNRIFPGKTGVVLEFTGGSGVQYYKVYKYHRILGIPIRLWLEAGYTTPRIILIWSLGKDGGFVFDDVNKAISAAKTYSRFRDPVNVISTPDVWNSHMKPMSDPNNKNKFTELSHAIAEDNVDAIIRISDELKRL